MKSSKKNVQGPVKAKVEAGTPEFQFGVYVGGTSVGSCEGPASCSPFSLNRIPES